MKTTRILLAEGDDTVRSALKLALGEIEGVEIVGQASDARQALVCATYCHPDVLLLSWDLRDGPPAFLLAEFKRTLPGLRVVALSGRPEARKMALAVGADVFVSKMEPPDRLVCALRQCACETLPAPTDC